MSLSPLELFTEVEAAEILKESHRTLQGLRLRGTGPRFVKLGRGLRAPVRYRRSDLEAWIEANTRTFTGERAAP